MAVGDEAVGEDQFTGVHGVPAELPQFGPAGVAGGAGRHVEGGEAFPPVLVTAGGGQQGDALADVGAGVGDEHLGAVDHPTAVRPAGGGGDAGRVGPGARLGQAERAEGLAPGQRGQPALLLLLGAVGQQRKGGDGGVRVPGGGHRLVGGAEFLHDGDVGDHVGTRARVLLGDEHAHQAEFAELGEDRGGELLVLRPLGRVRGDLLGRELADHVLQVPGLLRQIEIHVTVPSGSAEP